MTTLSAGEERAPVDSGRDGLGPPASRGLRALDDAGVRWAILRPPSSDPGASGDIDLLVDPADVLTGRRALEQAGFAALPGWDGAPNLLLFAWDRDCDRWAAFDVVTELRYGRLREGRTAARACLARRRPARPGWTLDPRDGFWALMWHGLAEKPAVAVRHRARLVELARTTPTAELLASPLAAAVEAATAAELLHAVRDECWAVVESFRPALRRAGHSPLHSVRASNAVRTVGRAVKTRGLLRRRRGVTIALLGANGVGKSTLARHLAEGLPLPTRSIYLGLWKQNDGLLAAVPGLPAATRPLVAWAGAARGAYHSRMGRTVIYDRYPYDALLRCDGSVRRVKRPYLWVLAHSCPRPDAVVLLDAPAAVAHARKAENSLEETEHESRAYRRLADRIPGIVTIDAARPAGDVRRDVVETVWNRYLVRWSS